MKKIMKVKNVLMAMVFSVAVLGGYQAYEQVSHTNADSFLLENVEALATSSDTHHNRVDCRITTFSCKVRIADSKISGSASYEDLKAKGSLAGDQETWKLNLTDATVSNLYGKGHSKCGSDITCNTVLQQYGILEKIEK